MMIYKILFDLTEMFNSKKITTSIHSNFDEDLDFGIIFFVHRDNDSCERFVFINGLIQGSGRAHVERLDEEYVEWLLR